jgi:hypothetical protein
MHARSTSGPETDGESSPLVGVLMLGLIAALLSSLVAVATLGGGPSEADAGAGVGVDFDRSHSRVVATYVASKNADYVNVTVHGDGGSLRVRLDAPGSQLVVDRQNVTVRGAGTIYDIENDIVVSDHGSQRGDLAGRGPSPGSEVEVTAVAVTADGARSVVFEKSGRI